MSTLEEQSRYLQQIPVFALRQMVNDHFAGKVGEARLIERMQAALGRRPRRVRQAIGRLARQELTLLINACPEIDAAEIATAFEQYRYGSNPSFYIYLFDSGRMLPSRLDELPHRMDQALVDDNARFAGDVSRGLPPLRDVRLNDFGPFPEQPGLFEGTYRFLSRLDYIDDRENAISTYETLYGFFWINSTGGYVTIHARRPEVLSSLRLAIEEAVGVTLTHLVISKQFKNALRFLDPRQFRSSRLYEPDPEAKRFRWLTISDGRAYDKGYQAFEDSYPELRSTRYRISVAGKETTVGVTCDRGALSLAGQLEASQFRAWAVESLAEVIRVVQALRTDPAAYVRTYGLRSAPPLAAYPSARQKDLVLELLSGLLTLKKTGQQALSLDRPATEVAIALRGDMAAQVPCVCADPDCEGDNLIACPMCGERFLSVMEGSDGLRLACGSRPQHWQVVLPFSIEAECGRTATIDAAMMRDGLELLPSARLMATLAQLANNHLGGEFGIDLLKEGFFLRGSTLHYYADKDAWLAAFPKDSGKVVYVERLVQEVQNNYGSVIGVLTQPAAS